MRYQYIAVITVFVIVFYPSSSILTLWEYVSLYLQTALKVWMKDDY